MVYEIRVKGHLDEEYWAQWFDGLTVTVTDDGETVLTGPVADQAALFGLLTRIRDLALPLLSVNCADRRNAQAVSKSAAKLKKSEEQ